MPTPTNTNIEFNASQLGHWIFESSPDCVKILDLDGRITAMNRHGQCILEIDDFISVDRKLWTSLWPEENHPAIHLAMAEAKTGRTGHFEAFCPTVKGTPKWWDVMVTPILDNDGRVDRLLAVSRDVSAVNEARETLREIAARQRFMLEYAPGGEWELDLLTNKARQSLRHDRCFGYTEPITQWGFEPFIQHVHPNDRDWVRTEFGSAISEQRDWRFECRVVWPDQSTHWIWAHGGLYHAQDKSARLIGIVADITERKRNEEGLQRLAADLSEADRRKTEFLATLAHELRNPLAPIMSGIEVVRQVADNPAIVVRVLDIMERQATQMVHLIDDLLDIARITRGQMDLKKEWVNVNAVVASAVETSLPLINAGRHHLTVNFPEESLLLDADPTRIAQVVSNLLNNAAKYTPVEGCIELSVCRDGSAVVISVIDSGIGIPKKSLPSVFEMFTQIRQNKGRVQGGLGIGLALVRQLVELHGGTVTAASAGAGKGSTFIVRLPLTDKPCPPAMFAAQAAIDTNPAKQLRVLVVDDNTDAAETLSSMLEMMGHATRVANDGYQALQMAEAFRPELVFLDIGLPGMNGYKVARALRKTPAMERVVLVALTGWGAESDRARSNAAGFDHHLTKPADLAAINGVLLNLDRFSVRTAAGAGAFLHSAG